MDRWYLTFRLADSRGDSDVALSGYESDPVGV
jgi:hypothetical protein